MATLNLLVLRAKQPEKLAAFYSTLGLEFHEEQHGSGPKHFCSVQNGSIFEIYPLKNSAEGTQNTRLGFAVDSIDRVIDAIQDRARVLMPATNSAWGRRAVVIDPEGHRVELVENHLG